MVAESISLAPSGRPEDLSPFRLKGYVRQWNSYIRWIFDEAYKWVFACLNCTECSGTLSSRYVCTYRTLGKSFNVAVMHD